MPKNKPQNLEELIENIGEYWFNAGKWHLASCHSILDWAVGGDCRCNTEDNLKSIYKALGNYLTIAKKESYEEGYADGYDLGGRD